jgi:transposase
MARERSEMRRVKEVLRLRLAFGLSHKAISAACRMPRTTVRDYCQRAKAAGLDSFAAVEPLSERALEARLFTTGVDPDAPDEDVARPPAGRPTPDWATVHRELNKPGVTRILLWQEYLVQHPGGYRYTQFTQLYKAWAAGALEPRMRRQHQPGAMIEVDYAGMTLPIRIGDTIRAAAVFTACLPYSGYLFAEATWTQASEDWLASHVRLFAHLGGVPGKLVPDNLKTGITHASFFDPVVNRDYLDLAQHYTVAVVPTRTRRPRDKASVENGVLQVERRVLAPLRHRTFGSLEEANRAIATQLALVNAEPLSMNRAASRLSLFRDEEQAALRPLPPEPFVIGRWSRLKVPPDYHVGVDGVAYSVPFRLIGQRVDIHRTPTLVSIFHDGVRVAAHARQQASGRGAAVTLDEHRPPHHRAAARLTPEALQAAAQAIGPATGLLVERLFARADHVDQAIRAAQGVVKLGQVYGPAMLEAAAEAALAANVVSYRFVAALLRRGAIPPPEPAAGGAGTHGNVRGPGYYH